MADGSFNPVVQPDIGQTMNTVLGLQQKKQALQTGQYTQESAAAKADSDTRTNAQSYRIAAYMANPANRGKKADDMKDDLISIGGEQGQAAYEKQLALEQKETELKGAQSKLSTESRGIAGDIIGAQVGSVSTNKDMAHDFRVAAKANPQIAETMGHYADLLESGQVPDTDGKTPNPARDQLVNQVTRTLGAKSPLAGSLTDTGPGLAQTTTNANTGQITVGPQVATKGLAPTEQVGYKAASAGATANAGARATGEAGADVQRANDVSANAKGASNIIPLTQEAERLADEINSGNLSKWAKQKIADLGIKTDGITSQQLLSKVMGQIKTQATGAAGTDSQRATIESGFPSETSTPETIHSAMDLVRGQARQNLAQSNNLDAYRTKHPDLGGFQHADDVKVKSATPLMHEYNSLSTDKDRATFVRRHFPDRTSAQSFLNSVDGAAHANGF